jgi:hypothetical protein
MKRNIGKLSTGPQIVRGTTKIDAVSGHKGLVSLQDEGFQFPVFPSSFAHPNHMGAFDEAAPSGYLHQIQTQTLINQEFHHAVVSLIRRCVGAFS